MIICVNKVFTYLVSTYNFLTNLHTYLLIVVVVAKHAIVKVLAWHTTWFSG